LKNLDRFSKNIPKTKFHENPTSRAEMFHADGQTGGTMLIVAFRNILNAAKNLFLLLGLEAWIVEAVI
jgi:hypothetical protein